MARAKRFRRFSQGLVPNASADFPDVLLAVCCFQHECEMVQHGVRPAGGLGRPLAGKPDARSAEPAFRSHSHGIVCPGRTGGAIWRTSPALVRDCARVLRSGSCGVCRNSQHISPLFEPQPGNRRGLWRNANSGDSLGEDSQSFRGIAQRGVSAGSRTTSGFFSPPQSVCARFCTPGMGTDLPIGGGEYRAVPLLNLSTNTKVHTY